MCYCKSLYRDVLSNCARRRHARVVIVITRPFRILSTLRQRHFYTATTATAKQRLGRPPQTSARAGASSFIIILAHSFPEHFTAYA